MPSQTTVAQLNGTSIADLSGPIITVNQFGGAGMVLNKALVIAGQLRSAISSIEYVRVLESASVGEHEQTTDEIYVIFEGSGELTTNGEKSLVKAGDLVCAPRGTRHSIRNASDGNTLGFLVIEVAAQNSQGYEPITIEGLPERLQENSRFRVARLRKTEVPLQVAQVLLSSHFSGPWGRLALFTIPPGGRIDPYKETEWDENLFVPKGHATIYIEEQPFLTDEDGHGLNALVPAGISRAITNRSSVETLQVLSVLIHHTERE